MSFLRRRNTTTACPALLVVMVVLSACGADEGFGEPDPTTITTDRVQVADARFDGEFQITSLTIDGQDIGLDSRPILSIETVFGGLSLMAGCNTYFGSFTLSEDGEASFTIAGGSSQECADLAEQEQAVLDALAATTRWEQTDGGFRFTDEGGTELTARR